MALSTTSRSPRRRSKGKTGVLALAVKVVIMGGMKKALVKILPIASFAHPDFPVKYDLTETLDVVSQNS
jgi:hypothetical protein